MERLRAPCHRWNDSRNMRLAWRKVQKEEGVSNMFLEADVTRKSSEGCLRGLIICIFMISSRAESGGAALTAQQKR